MIVFVRHCCVHFYLFCKPKKLGPLKLILGVLNFHNTISAQASGHVLNPLKIVFNFSSLFNLSPYVKVIIVFWKTLSPNTFLTKSAFSSSSAVHRPSACSTNRNTSGFIVSISIIFVASSNCPHSNIPGYHINNLVFECGIIRVVSFQQHDMS